ncbi:MAG: DUF1015 domain-containing protein [Clostridia bacterium]|nr:DUF1015 domain-containing protein [Clostridia bacterium]
MKQKSLVFRSAEILLPDFEKIDGSLWSVVACDQFTSEGAYWASVEQTVKNAPSTLSMILPELYLNEAEARVPLINQAMREQLQQNLRAYPDAMIYLARTQSDGSVRRGIIGAIDLECYDYSKGSTSPVRATEGTVLERIPPRVAIRRDAPLELPHIMLLIDDERRSVIEPLIEAYDNKAPLYDFDLMEGGGHVRGHLLDPATQESIQKALAALILPEEIGKKYGDATLAPLWFAVGDGNHSLATAKASYEEIKAAIGEEAAKSHPARYALAEVVNLHDDALNFEPIYRVVFGCNPEQLKAELLAYIDSLNGTAAAQRFTLLTEQSEEEMEIPAPVQQLTVGTLQAFLDVYIKRHPEVEVDYIHGEDSLRSLVKAADTVGFLFEGMRKDELFRTVMFDGALPRKTFSMGHARDKRYYLECRKIK